MATELQGLTPSVIITKLDKLSISTILTRRDMNYSGRLYGRINGVEFNGTGVRVPSGYLLHVSFAQIGNASYPLYVSTSGSIESNRARERFVYEEDEFKLMENLLVLHDSIFEPTSKLAGSVEVHAQRNLTVEGKAQLLLDEKTKDCYECRMQVDGEASSSAGLAGEIMELDGSFKLKLRKGRARRDYGEWYPLMGDQEFVLNGHVIAEVGSVSMFKERRYLRSKNNKDWFYVRDAVSPSFVKVSAQGQLVV